jgi:hypothetical protein
VFDVTFNVNDKRKLFEESKNSGYFSAVFLKLWSAVGIGRKSIAKIVSNIEQMKNTPIHVLLKLPFLVDLKQKVCELVLFITSCT